MSKELKKNLQKRRNTKSIRVGVIIILLIIVLLMYFIGGKLKGLLLVLIVILLTALGLQVTDYDMDMTTLRQTGSFEESRVEHRKGVKIIGTECISDNINCDHFTTQDQAQAKYEDCAAKIARDNEISDDVKNLDVYGLDGDKDGIVCEHLPSDQDQ